MARRTAKWVPADIHRVALERLLQRAAGSLIVCDSAFGVLSTAGGGERLLSDGELPSELLRTARQRLREPAGTSRVVLPRGRVVHMTRVEAVPGPFVLIWLREETARHEVAARMLRDRYGLAVRGQQLLALLREGLTNREIAERLALREGTVKTYLYELYRALGVKNRTGALACVERSLNFD
jgi:DNA-binding CsgD family transcriptional regulator